METDQFDAKINNIILKMSDCSSQKKLKNLFFEVFNVDNKINPGVFEFIYNLLIKKMITNGDYEIINEDIGHCITINNYELSSQVVISFDVDMRNFMINHSQEYIVNEDMFDDELSDYLSGMLNNSTSDFVCYNYEQPNEIEVELYYAPNSVIYFSKDGDLKKIETTFDDIEKYNYLDRVYDIFMEYYEAKLDLLNDLLNKDEEDEEYISKNSFMYQGYTKFDFEDIEKEYEKTEKLLYELEPKIVNNQLKIKDGNTNKTYNSTIYDADKIESYTFKTRVRNKE